MGLCQDCRKLTPEKPQTFSFKEGSEQGLCTDEQTINQGLIILYILWTVNHLAWKYSIVRNVQNFQQPLL